MDEMLKIFEKALAEHKVAVGKTDNLVGIGEIMLKEFRKMRDANVILGQLLAEFFAEQKAHGQKYRSLTSEQDRALAYQRLAEQLRNQGIGIDPPSP